MASSNPRRWAIVEQHDNNFGETVRKPIIDGETIEETIVKGALKEGIDVEELAEKIKRERRGWK